MSRLNILLQAERLAEMFPFHLAFDAELRIVRVGPALQRLYPEARPGAPLAAHFRVARPRGASTFAEIARRKRAAFTLEPLAGGPALRGQMLPLAEAGLVAFLGAPWIADAARLSDAGLAPRDIPGERSEQSSPPPARCGAPPSAEPMHLETEGDLPTVGPSDQFGTASERARLYEKARRERDFNAALVDMAGSLVCVLDRDGRIVRFNRASERASGYRFDEVRGRPFWDILLPPEDIDAVRAIFARLAEGDSPVPHENYWLTRDGRRRLIAWSNTALDSADGQPEYIVSTGIDITEQRQAEAALLESEATLRSLYDSTPFLMGVIELVDDELVFISVNKAGVLRFGRSQESIRGQPLGIVLSPDQLAVWREACDTCLRLGQATTFEYQRQIESQTHWRCATIGLIDRRPGERPRFAYVTEDITERKHAEAALRAAEAQYRTLVEQMPAIIYTADLDEHSRTRYVSPQIETILGFTPEEWIADPELWLKRIHLHDRALVLADVESAHLTDAPHSGEYRAIARDGRVVWLRDTARVVHDDDGRPLFMQGLTLDITDRKQAEHRSLAFAALGRQLGSATTAEAAAQIIADMADDLLGWDAFVLNLYSAETDLVQQVLSYDIVDGRRTRVHLPRAGISPSPITRRVFVQGPLLIALDSPEEDRKTLRSFGDKDRDSAALLFVPIRHGEMPIGLLSIQSYTPHAYTAQDLDTLQSLADHCSAALERIGVAESLHESEERFRLLFKYLPDGVVLIDPHHPSTSWPIVECNDTICVMNGYTREELIGQTIDILHFATAEPDERAAYLARLRREGMIHLETIHRRKDGSFFYVEVLTSLISIAGRELVLGIDRDITERKRFEAELAQARDEALEAARLKSEFLATVSHEIRTPMNGVIGMAELLLDTPLDAEQREFAQTITSSAQALLTIINDILDYSKIEAGKLILDDAALAVAELVGSVSSLLSARARAKSLALAAEIAAGVPTHIRGDAGRLRQVLLNLVGNAIKFTERGGVTIEVERVDAGGPDVTLRFAIRDTGIGIAESARQRLFQPFSQADGSVTRKYGGTGLGLAISKSLVELMGGAIGCESVEGQGSTFWFVVRFDTATAEHLPAVPPEPRPATASPRQRGHLLLVEDHPVNQQIARRQLAKLGYSIDIATNGREAVELFERAGERYQLVLMDAHMPVMDGYAAARSIRERERARGGHIPIVAMTASALQSDREACVAAGMDDFLSKPVRLEVLGALLARWIAPPALPEPAPVDEALFEPDTLAELRGFDADADGAFAGLVRSYLKEGAAQLAELEAALASGDAASLAGAAHRLRGSSAYLGATRLVESCRLVEAAGRAARLDEAAARVAEVHAAFARVRDALLGEIGQ